jgi:DNA-binding HxlR family transcriptional regulator
MVKAIDKTRLRAAIIETMEKNGPDWSYVISNYISRPDILAGKPAACPGATTDVVRRELQRMERDGLVERCPSISIKYINWRLTDAGHAAAQADLAVDEILGLEPLDID